MNTLQTLIDSARAVAMEALNRLDDEARGALEQALESGCVIELRICPQGATLFRLMVLNDHGGEIELCRLPQRYQ
jgi:hypothetical protein